MLEAPVGAVPAGSARFLLLCLGSSACHVTYSLVSTRVVLRCMSVVGHAVANVLKRALVVLLLQLTGWRPASGRNWAGLALCTCGLLAYNLGKVSASLTPWASWSSW